MSGEESRLIIPFKLVYLPIPIPDVRSIIEKYFSRNRSEFINYLNEAQICFYKAIRSLIDSRIKALEESQKKRPLRERVKVE